MSSGARQGGSSVEGPTPIGMSSRPKWFRTLAAMCACAAVEDVRSAAKFELCTVTRLGVRVAAGHEEVLDAHIGV